MILLNKLRQNLVTLTLITSSIVLGINTIDADESVHIKKFVKACKNKDFATVESLITKRNKKEISFNINEKDVNNNTPLMLTIRHQKEGMIHEYENIVYLLLAQDDIKVNETNTNGKSAFMLADAAANSANILKSLVAHKGNGAHLYKPRPNHALKFNDETDEEEVKRSAVTTLASAVINGKNEEIIKILLIRTVEELLANNFTPDDLQIALFTIRKIPAIKFKTLFTDYKYDSKYCLDYLLLHRHTDLLLAGKENKKNEENKSIELTLNNTKYTFNINIIHKIIGYVGFSRDFTESHGKIIRFLRYKAPKLY